MCWAGYLDFWAYLSLVCIIWPILMCLEFVLFHKSCDHHDQGDLKKKLQQEKQEGITCSWMTMCQNCENELGFGPLQAMKVWAQFSNLILLALT